MQSNQRGGIVSFIVVTLALVGLLAGGLYLSKTQARQTRDGTDSTQQVARDETKDATETPANGDAENQPANTDEPATGTTNEPGRADTPSATPAPTTPTNRVANTGPSAEIPATGTGDVLMYAFGLGALVLTSYQLVQSRRMVRENALKR